MKRRNVISDVHVPVLVRSEEHRGIPSNGSHEDSVSARESNRTQRARSQEEGLPLRGLRR